MKAARRNLLDALKNRRPFNTEEPLKNIKQALGSMGNVKGNPLTKTEITFNIRIQYWDNIAGVFLAPGALPGGQNQIPIYVFGLTDFHGGFIRSRTNLPILPPWVWNAIAQPTIGIWNYNFWNAGGWTVNIADGDWTEIIFLNLPAVNIIGIATIHCENVAYGTFLNNFSSDVVYLNKIRVITPAANPTQLDNPFTFMYQSQFGKTFSDTIDPRMYTKPKDFQGNMVDIPVKMPVDKNFSMNFYMNFDCQDISMILFIEKVTN